MKRSEFPGLILGALALLLMAGCSGSEGEPAAAIHAPEKIIQVVTESLTPSDLTEYFTLPGSLEAWEDLVLSAEIAGPVRQLLVVEGDRVKAGQPLLEIDSDTIQSTYQRDLENYQVIQRKYQRYGQLLSEGLISQQELDDLQNSLAAAAAGLKNTGLALKKSKPVAPVAGVIDLLYIDRGEFIDMGKPLLRLVQVDQLKVLADVPEKDVPFLRIGQAVEIIPAIVNDRRIYTVPGTIDHIAYAADDLTRTYRCKIVIDNQSELLRPGMIVRVRFIRQQLKQVLAVPLYAVLDRDGEKLVFVEENGVARKINVKTGSSVGERVVIVAGLKPEQQVVVKGQQLLFDGARIQAGGY
jgi:membrane fusion protein (multidrug efflux system)